MAFVQVIAIALMGRWWGSDEFKTPLKKPLSCLIAGLVFLPHWQLSLVVFIGLWIGHLLRDSVFDLLRGWNTKKALYMTFRACSFLPLFLAVYYLMHGLVLHTSLVLILLPVLARAPIQYLCGFLPLPENASSHKGAWQRFFLGKAEVYELLWCAIIGLGVVWL